MQRHLPSGLECGSRKTAGGMGGGRRVGVQRHLLRPQQLQQLAVGEQQAEEELRRPRGAEELAELGARRRRRPQRRRRPEQHRGVARARGDQRAQHAVGAAEEAAQVEGGVLEEDRLDLRREDREDLRVEVRELPREVRHRVAAAAHRREVERAAHQEDHPVRAGAHVADRVARLGDERDERLQHAGERREQRLVAEPREDRLARAAEHEDVLAVQRPRSAVGALLVVPLHGRGKLACVLKVRGIRRSRGRRQAAHSAALSATDGNTAPAAQRR